MKTIDITEKLNFDGNPKLIIKGKPYEVNADAATVLKIMGEIGDGTNATAKTVVNMYELLFPEKTRKDIDKLNLQFSDFQTVVSAAIELVTGESDQGE